MSTTETVRAWATSNAGNAAADAAITSSDAQSPDTIDNNIRSVMAAVKKQMNDIGGSLVAGGSANALTVTTGQVLESGQITDGLRILVKATADNTSATVTFAPDGLTAANIKRADGSALAVGSIKSGMYLDLVYNSGSSEWRCTNIAPVAAAADYQAFTANSTWTKPTGISSNAVTIVEAWAPGGGGGANASGGGGGGYARKEFLTSTLGATETVTVPAGGAVNTAGGNSTFGSWLTAYGGGAGANAANGGGGGGGETSLGSNGSGSSGGAGGGPQNAPEGVFGVSGGGGGASTGGNGYFGGGGGGQGHSGGSSVYGGGGGASVGGTGGASKFAGAGGNDGLAGTAPGGGGGRNAAGGRGEIQVRTIG